MDKETDLPNPQTSPLVSICIPAYNSELTLGETLETILAQDYPNLDIVVSDNRSTDSTKAIVQKYAGRGVRYCTPSNRPEWAANLPSYIGAYINSNFVMSQAHGEYLCLFHSDDLYEPSIVRQQAQIMRAYSNVGAVFTRMRMIGEDGRPIKQGLSKFPQKLREHPIFGFESLLNETLNLFDFLPTPSVMLRRSVVEKIGGFDERHFFTSADLEMWLRIAYQGYEIAFIDQPLLKYRISQRQFGEQYNKLRTTVGDFFIVLDHYLSQPAVQALAKAGPLRIYELRRATDKILCAINLLTQARIPEAITLLRQALQVQHLVTAFKRPHLLARLVLGFCLLVITRLGFGAIAGQLVYRAYQRNLQQRRKPLENSKDANTKQEIPQ